MLENLYDACISLELESKPWIRRENDLIILNVIADNSSGSLAMLRQITQNTLFKSDATGNYYFVTQKHKLVLITKTSAIVVKESPLSYSILKDAAGSNILGSYFASNEAVKFINAFTDALDLIT